MNTFNKKTILFFSITSLMINGCVAKNEFEPKKQSQTFVKKQAMIKNKKIANSSWGKIASVKAKKDDCIDCYAASMDYSKPPSATNNAFRKLLDKPSEKLSSSTYPKFASNSKIKEIKSFGKYPYQETASDVAVKRAMSRSTTRRTNVIPAPMVQNSSAGSLTHRSMGNMSIQVGAFRNYSGAQSYANKYNALSDKYKVAIKTGTKNNKPLHRVRIEGFKSKSEAKNFMYSYNISDGFLVR